MDENFAKFRYDHLLFTFLFVVVGHAKHCNIENFNGLWHAIAAPQTFEKMNETFDDVGWILTIN
jgi:hypothetical protein